MQNTTIKMENLILSIMAVAVAAVDLVKMTNLRVMLTVEPSRCRFLNQKLSRMKKIFLIAKMIS
jgi:hypothetical protein